LFLISACAIQIVPGDFLIMIEDIELIILIDFCDLSGQRKPFFTVFYFSDALSSPPPCLTLFFFAVNNASFSGYSKRKENKQKKEFLNASMK